MLVHPQFDPIALDLSKIGLPIAIHWYGLTYLVGFALFLFLAVRRSRLPQYAATGWTRRDVEDLLFYGVMGTVIGGRLGYVLFYKPAFYAANPLEIFAVWKGGMAFHGGLLGVIVALALFARMRKRPFLEVTDLVAPCVPTGFAAGRIGNFINGELWGRFSSADLPWGMVFPQSGSALPRHPSQLYQVALEGLLLFAVLWIYGKKPRGLGQVSGVFLAGYGVFRFIAEFFREPDSFLGLLALGMSMGQWLCVPMIVAGIALWAWGRGRAPGDPAGLPLAPRQA
jgi:phosphatidylglycerol:prolipoprotein diacylglycerol transferase